MLRALEAAATMARACGTGTVVVRRSHHIACLAAYLKRATDAGLVAIIESSDPTVIAVAPHGGMTPFITPNPIAAGLPTSGDPILIDVSTSITSMGYAHAADARRQAAARRVADRCRRQSDRRSRARCSTSRRARCCHWAASMPATRDSRSALLIEAMTAGLAGHGRADPPDGLGRTVFVQVFDPEAFGGLAAFKRQMDFVADAARNAKPRPGVDRVRLPGERGMQRYREQLAHGVALYPTILPVARALGGEVRRPTAGSAAELA